MKRGLLDQLKLDTEFEGYAPGSPQFDAVLRKKQVEACMEMKALVGCDECEAYDSCEIVKAYLRDLHFGVEVNNGTAGERRTTDGSDTGSGGQAGGGAGCGDT